jgi:amino-acid N-acetyltransferase
MTETQDQPLPAPSPDPFVGWFRQTTPYIHAHRGRTFVIAFGGEVLATGGLPSLVHDIALLHGLGIRLVLVHGARPQIEERLALRGAKILYAGDLRVTDDAALACVKEAAGVVRVELEALLSLGLANSPMAGVRIPVASGNFVTARPLGVIGGVDHRHTGTVRRIDRRALQQRLADGAVALMPPIGYSPTGEVFNLSAADVAGSAAAALDADKLIFLTEAEALVDAQGRTVTSILERDVEELLTGSQGIPGEIVACLNAAAHACRRGVHRAHLVPRRVDGALLRELFTRDGIGTLVSGEPFETLRPARVEDIPGIMELLRPLEEIGVLLPRPRERLEADMDRFFVMERDGTAIGCAALHPYPAEAMGELACIAVHPDYRGQQRGDKLLQHIETVARNAGIQRLFVLTTQTAHWFRERGFEPASLTDLPSEKQALYSFVRNSQVYVKPI